MSDFAAARQKMVDGQIRPSDVTDRWIIEAMLAIPREVFVPPDQQALAYLDLDLDIGHKRYLIKPVVAARLLQAAGVKPTDKVLVVGCATGYFAAVVARLAGRVTATEPDAVTVETARRCLSAAGVGNVTLEAADPGAGAPDHAPFDVILLNGATEVAPDALYRQLAEGGRLAGVFATTRPPRATIVTNSNGDFGIRALFDATVPVLPGLSRPAAFVF